jgi:uridine kinase
MQTTIIGIAGGSGSGKSSFSNRLKEQFQDDITVIYYDNYYKDNTGIPFEERKKINYDHPDALETSLLVEHLKKLRQGQAIDCPVYDYSVHNRSDQTIHVEPKPVIVVAGILTLYDPSLLEQLDVRIYFEADADERILRRLRRDVVERGRDIDGIIEQYLTTVKPMHARYVEPTRALADLVINSGLNDIALDVVSTKIQALIDSQTKE